MTGQSKAAPLSGLLSRVSSTDSISSIGSFNSSLSSSTQDSLPELYYNHAYACSSEPSIASSPSSYKDEDNIGKDEDIVGSTDAMDAVDRLMDQLWFNEAIMVDASKVWRPVVSSILSCITRGESSGPDSSTLIAEVMLWRPYSNVPINPIAMVRRWLSIGGHNTDHEHKEENEEEEQGGLEVHHKKCAPLKEKENRDLQEVLVPHFSKTHHDEDGGENIHGAYRQGQPTSPQKGKKQGHQSESNSIASHKKRKRKPPWQKHKEHNGSLIQYPNDSRVTLSSEIQVLT